MLLLCDGIFNESSRSTCTIGLLIRDRRLMLHHKPTLHLPNRHISPHNEDFHAPYSIRRIAALQLMTHAKDSSGIERRNEEEMKAFINLGVVGYMVEGLRLPIPLVNADEVSDDLCPGILAFLVKDFLFTDHNIHLVNVFIMIT